MVEMRSKERVLATLARQKPDRVPINYKANAGVDARLKAHYGLAGDDTEGLRRTLGVDFRELSAPYIGPNLHGEVPERQIDSIWGRRTRWIEHESGGYWDYCDFPLRDADEAAIAAWPQPSADDYDYTSVQAECARYSEYAIFIGNPGLGDIINSNGMIRTMEQVLVDLITDDAAGLALIDRKVEHELEVTERTLEAAAGGIDFMWLGEDLGTQIGPLISLELYRRHLRPRHQKYVDLAKSYELPVIVHTCGSSSWVYEDFIDMGVDAVDTLQPEVANMAPAYLVETFGGRLAFHGCISTAGPVAYGSPEEVANYCRETLEIMMPGGAYCFAPTHQLQDNSPTENVVTMYEVAHAHGRYN